MKNYFLATLLLSALSVSAHAAPLIKAGTYQSDDCTVDINQNDRGTYIEVYSKSPKNTIYADHYQISNKNISLDGPSLCTDNTTFRDSLTSSLTTNGGQKTLKISCGGPSMPIDVSLDLVVSADGSLVAIKERQSLAKIAILGGLSPKETTNLACTNLVRLK